MKTRTYLALGAALFVLATLINVAEAQGAQWRTTFAIKAITHNIAGGAIHEGRTTALTVVERQIKQYHPDVVMLQEVCVSQLEALKRWHPDWDFAWAQNTHSHHKCDGDGSTVDGPNEDIPGDELGDVLMTPYALSNIEATVLPHSGQADSRGWTRYQHLVCGDFTKAATVIRTCSTHVMVRNPIIDTTGTMNADQIRTIARVTAPYRSRGPVVVGGDFNALPTTPNVAPMWDRFQEVLYRPSVTPHRGRPRIDYLWYGGLRTREISGVLDRANVSDHPIIRGAALAKKR